MTDSVNFTFVPNREVRVIPAGWQHPRPTNRKAVGFQPDLFHQGNIFFKAVIVVASDAAVFVIVDDAGFAAEYVPNRQTFTIHFGCAFNLV